MYAIAIGTLLVHVLGTLAITLGEAFSAMSGRR